MKNIAPERVRALFTYDPETGSFVRRSDGWHSTAIRGRGYYFARVDRHDVPVHRLIWLYVYGRWPREQIDHINGIRTDNRLANLRECSCAENHQNRVASHRARSRYVGVDFNKETGKWRASIMARGVRHYLGYFATEDEAAAAYAAAKRTLHPFQPTPREALCA